MPLCLPHGTPFLVFHLRVFWIAKPEDCVVLIRITCRTPLIGKLQALTHQNLATASD